ncbi:MAG TPA: hypothetical protein VFQ54_01435, partial [Thermomicrobiales bacterium]|nr:hypothetical protein [Thermomicrobiales bacterium]
MSSPTNKLSRRAFTGAAAGAAALAAAPLLRAGAQGASPSPVAQGASPSPVASAPLAVGTPEDQLEIFSWWTSGGEAAGLQKLFDSFTV